METPAFFRPSCSQRSARLTRCGGFRPERRPVPGHHLVPGTALDSAQPIIGPQGPDMRCPAGALAPCRVFSDRQGGFCRQRVQTGRRLMRQTVLSTKIPGKTAPMRSHRSARRFASPGSRSARRALSRFGLPLTPESGGPSPLPAARNARTVRRDRRLQELQNAQQNAYRCHPSGGDPGRRGPRQSRRRI